MKLEKSNLQIAKWPRVKLGEICDLVNGDAYRETDWSDEGVPIIRIQNLNNPEKPFNYWTGSIDDRVVVKPGDVLLAWSGTPGTSFGTHRWTRGIGILNQHIFRLDLDATRIDPEWAVFSINEQLEEMIDRAHGAVGLRHVTKGECESLPILLPPLPEQRRLAARLREQMAEVERARAAVQAQLDAAQTLPAALLRAIFTSPAAQHWPRHRLSELTMKIGSGYTPLGGQASYCTSGIPLIRSQNVLMNSFSTDGLAFIDEDQDNQMESSRVQSKDVLLNITGASIGRVCVVPDEICPANVNQHVSIIRLSEKMSVRFVAFYLSNPEFQKFIMGAQAGATRQALTKQQIENFDIPGPEVEMQEQIAGRLDAELTAARALAETLETRLAEIELLPATLLRDAFTQRTPTN